MGGIFDRAVKLYFDRFTLFACIALMAIVPVYLLQAYGSIAYGHVYDALAAQVASAKPLTALPPGFAGAAWFVALLIALEAVAGAFVNGAVALGVGKAGTGSPVGGTACIARVLRSWRSIAGVVANGFFVFLALSMAAGLLFGLAAGAIAVLHGHLLATVLIGTLFLCTLVPIVPLWLLCYAAIALALAEVGANGSRTRQAVLFGFTRVFRRAEISRAMLVVVIAFAVQMLLMIPAMICNALLAAVPAAALLAQACIGLVGLSFISVFFATYYYDVRAGSASAPLPTPTAGPASARRFTMLTDEEHDLIERFAQHCAMMEPVLRAQQAAELAARIRARLSYDLQGLPDEDLLRAVSGE